MPALHAHDFGDMVFHDWLPEGDTYPHREGTTYNDDGSLTVVMVTEADYDRQDEYGWPIPLKTETYRITVELVDKD